MAMVGLYLITTEVSGGETLYDYRSFSQHMKRKQEFRIMMYRNMSPACSVDPHRCIKWLKLVQW